VTSVIPRSVVAFLNEHVDHVVKLEFLLVVHAAPQSTTTVPDAARSLDVSRQQIRAMAEELATEGILRVSANFIELAPRELEDRWAIADLAHTYRGNREVVLEVLRGLGRLET
jgi:hypothetical protein